MNQEDGSFGKLGQRQPQSWLRYLALVPIVAGVALFSVFFFTAVIALFLLATLGFGARTWWLRRKLRSAVVGAHGLRDEPLEGEYSVVREDDRQNEGAEQRRSRR
ncbi:MAG: hypothetical protein ACYDHY_11365 [Acidiferrobacterales bacterium]